MMKEGEMWTLESLRDPGLPTRTYFYMQGKNVVSPYFNDAKEAEEWLSENVLIQKTKDNA